MPDKTAADGAAPDELHVVGIYSDNWGDSYKGAQPLLVVRCSREDADALKDALATVEPTVCDDFRYPTVDALDASPLLTRAAARAVALRYAVACTSLDADGVPWRGGGMAEDVRRHGVARAAGVNVTLFDLHLATRDLARACGLTIDDGRDGKSTPAKPISNASPPSAALPAPVLTAPPALLRPLGGEPGRFVDDADVDTFHPTSGPLPAEPVTADRVPVPLNILATYPVAGDVDAPCAAGHYVAVEYDAGGSVFAAKRRWLARSPVRRVLDRLADVLRIAFPPTFRGSPPAFVVVRGDALTDAQRFLIEDEFGGHPHTQLFFGDEGTLDEIASRVPGRLERFKKDERAADEDYAGELQTERHAAAFRAESRDERRRADPIRVIDAALDAMVGLRDVISSRRNRSNGEAKIAEAHNTFASAAGDVLHAHDAQGTFDPSLCRLPNVWGGRRCGGQVDGRRKRRLGGPGAGGRRTDGSPAGRADRPRPRA